MRTSTAPAMNTHSILNALMVVFLILALAPFSPAQTTELRALQVAFENQVIVQVTDVYNTALAKLDEAYKLGVERELAAAKSAGDLVGALALEGEKKRLAFKEAMPTGDEEAGKSLAKLRAIYRKELGKLNAQRANAQTAVLAPHLTQLKQLEADLTKADRLTDAKAVMDYRKELESGVPAKAVVAAVSNLAAPASAPPVPATPVAGSIEVASELAAKGGVKDIATGAIPFDGPSGDGRRGAKGVLLTNDPLTGKNGSTWSFTYTRQNHARVLEIIHPHGMGQVIIHIQIDGVGISTPESWVEVGYGPGDVNRVKKTREFGDVFPLVDDEAYPLVSKLNGQGDYELIMKGKVVVTARVAKTSPLSLEIKKGETFPGSGRDGLEFKGEGLPLKWAPGYAAVLVGPIDKGANVCREVRFLSSTNP